MPSIFLIVPLTVEIVSVLLHLKKNFVTARQNVKETHGNGEVQSA